MRGKASTVDEKEFDRRNTPACAGKSEADKLTPCYRQDVMSAKRRHIVTERRDKMAEETV